MDISYPFTNINLELWTHRRKTFLSPTGTLLSYRRTIDLMLPLPNSATVFGTRGATSSDASA